MAHSIFISYASGDLQYESDLKLFDTFCNDLINEVAVTVGVPAEGLAFRAKSSIQAGQNWTTELEHALCTSRVMLCCYSSHYFASVWCGREFAVFMDRRERWLKARPAGAAVGATHVIPAIWIPRTNVPACAASVQDRDDAYPPDYRKRGLRKIMDLQLTREYKEVVTALSARVIDALNEPPMPAAAALGDMHTICSAFHEQSTVAIGGAGRQRSSKNAYFVFAAANRDQLQGAKQQLDAWGAQDGWDWRPYFPTAPQSVGALAQLAAGNKNLRFHELSCDPGLAQRLKDAKGANAPVVIFTDPWTATLPAYRAVLADYDLLNLTNCALLVPWNETDAETAVSKPALEQNLRTVCDQKYRYKYPGHYWQIRSPEELRDRALSVLDEITLRILDQADPGELRKAESAALTSAAAAEGIPTEAPSQLVNVAPPPAPVETGPLAENPT